MRPSAFPPSDRAAASVRLNCAAMLVVRVWCAGWFVAAWMGIVSLPAVQAQERSAGNDDYLTQLAAEFERSRRQNEATELVEREPFDRIYLDAFNSFATMDIVPLLNPPSKPIPRDGNLIFDLPEDSLNQYIVPWINVIDFKTYNELVLEEADELVAKGEYARAFRNLMRVHDRSRVRDASLMAKIRTVMFLDAKANYDREEYDMALSIFEDIYRQDPGFRVSGINLRSLDLILDCHERAIQKRVADGEFANARASIVSVAERYGNATRGLVARMEELLETTFQAALAQAEGLIAEQRPRDARLAALRANEILPGRPEALAVLNRILTEFPLVFVGVSQPALRPDPNRLEDWASRRVGRLTQRRIVELTGLSDEGGRYEFLNGRFYPVDESGYVYRFEIDPSKAGFAVPPITANQLAYRLLRHADPAPDNPHYREAWAKILATVSVVDNQRVDVRLKVPYVRPEALLHFPYTDQLTPEETYDGPYVMIEGGSEYNVFRVNPRYAGSETNRYPELVEFLFDSPSTAVDALLRGELDLVDRVSPVDLARLRRHPNIELRSYLVPTVHMICINQRNEFTKMTMFRAGLYRGVNREVILKNGLLGGRAINGSEVIDGPFPIGMEDNDQIGYAYDLRLLPIVYSDVIARVMVAATVETIRNRLIEEQVEDTTVEIPEMILAHPAGEVATATCRSVAAMWALTGVKIRLRPLPPGVTVPDDDEYDFLYVEMMMNEPLVEADFLFGPQGLVKSLSAPTQQTMRQVSFSNSWRSASLNLRQLHRQLQNDASVIPLFQMREFYAYRSHVGEVGRDLIYLYQNVDQWQMLPMVSGETTQ